jgi:site-specific recombinase XerD
MKNINMNMLRERAEKNTDVDDSLWKLVNKENRELVEEFLSVSKQLSKQSIKQYTSGLKQFFFWIYENMGDKVFYKITKRDFMKYLGCLTERGLSSSALGFKKSSVSTFCNYIENIVADEVEEYKSFRNFTRGLPTISKNSVYEKIAITKNEYDLIMKTLKEDDDFLGIAWVAAAFNIGARRSELIQFKTEILNYIPKDGKNFVLSHLIRGKGKGLDGKPLRYMISLECMEYLKQYVENRGFSHEFIFAYDRNDKTSLLSREWANYFCQNKLTNILGRRVNPHLFKASCITYLLEKGKDIKVISKYVAQHESTETTTKAYDLRIFDKDIDNIFG